MFLQERRQIARSFRVRFVRSSPMQFHHALSRNMHTFSRNSGLLLVILLLTGVSGLRAQDAVRTTRGRHGGDALPGNVPAVARQHLDSARMYLERNEIRKALPHIEENYNLVSPLWEKTRSQHAEIDRQQEEIYQLRQDYQLLLGKYELMTMQHEVNYNWLKLERDKKSERAALEE